MFQHKARMFFVIFSAPHLLCACAGPTSPFGPINKITPVQKTHTDISLIALETDNHFKMDFYPKQQFYHKEDNLKLEITGKDRVPNIKNLRLIYNATDLTELLLKNSKSKVYPSDNFLRIEFDAMRFSARQLHQVSFVYMDELRAYTFRYGPPTCSIYKTQAAKGLHGFATPPEYLNLVNLSAREEKLNASLIAGLVAMESGFNPFAVSSAKAIGLTQMTDISVQQIDKKISHWPRRDLSSVSFTEVKEQINAGELSHESDWRLEPSLSLKGGASYIKYIISFWNMKEQKELLKDSGLTTDEQITDLVVASYNSGPDRIRKSIVKNKTKWLDDPDLKNVRYYLNMIYSYCNDFSEGPRS